MRAGFGIRPGLMIAVGGALFADGHTALNAAAKEQDVSGGAVSSTEIVADESGWMVGHRVGDKPGPVVGRAPLRAVCTTGVGAIRIRGIVVGEEQMPMVHGEACGHETGVLEHSLDAKANGRVRVGDDPVMAIVTTL